VTATINPSSTSANVGSTLTFAGTISPDKAGHVFYLERMGADGPFHVVATSYVSASSTYSFPYTFGTPGTKTFRVHIPGGNSNVGADSPPTVIASRCRPSSRSPGLISLKNFTRR
jgi:hypothetical protein